MEISSYISWSKQPTVRFKLFGETYYLVNEELDYDLRKDFVLDVLDCNVTLTFLKNQLDTRFRLEVWDARDLWVALVENGWEK